MAVKIVYKDVAPGAKEDIESIFASNYYENLSDIEMLKKDTVLPVKYATLEENQWRLDGAYKCLTEHNIPYISDDVSKVLLEDVDENGNLVTLYGLPAGTQLRRKFRNKHKSSGVSFTFDYPDYCAKLTIFWRNDGEEVARKTFFPKSAEYFCPQNVEVFDEIRINFIGMNRQNRFLKIWSIDDGVTRIYTDKDISSVTILEEMSLISEGLPLNTLDFSLVGQDGTELMFQEKQPILAFQNNEIIGMFFVDSGERISKNIYEVSASDYKGILNKNVFYGGVYVNELAGNIINQIFKDEKVELEIDDNTFNTPLSGYLKIDTKRNALMQVLFATCSVCSTARTNSFKIFKLPMGTTTVPADRIKDGGKVKAVSKPTSVKINVHQYVKSVEEKEVFSGEVLQGENFIEFSAPVDIDSIISSAGNLIEKHNNYCVVEIDEPKEITITAKEYIDNVATKELKDPDRLMGKTLEVKEITDATLISNSNYEAVLSNVYNYYMMNESVECDMQIIQEQVGDEITLQTSWSGTKTGRVEQLEYGMRGKKIGKVVQRING